MKTILIETVKNGWLVRPFTPCEHWAHAEASETYVFRDIHDLQEQLPEMLEVVTGNSLQDKLDKIAVGT